MSQERTGTGPLFCRTVRKPVRYEQRKDVGWSERDGWSQMQPGYEEPQVSGKGHSD